MTEAATAGWTSLRGTRLRWPSTMTERMTSLVAVAYFIRNSSIS
jgi:hypothetical protein